LAEQSAASDGAEIMAIQGNADVSMGAAVEEVLDALEAAGRGRFRGVRYITAQDDHPPLAMYENAAMSDRLYLEGVRRVGELGYTYDAMVYHPQLSEVVGVAQACPDTPIVLDHLGGILGTGPYSDQRDEILDYWKKQMAAIAACNNVFLKLGGIGMPMMGFRWDKRDKPGTSAELAEAWSDPIQYAIEVFGAERCMFESNFPVDKRGVGYVPLWNSFKLIASSCSTDEKRDLFYNTAARAYRLPLLEKS
ncbi:MAG TPA: amidohydrolase, partial [Acidimicrobiaceae bacterium]|nr:amidohydrolase [Acidimicrobiaceae bacterium]